MKKLSCSGGDTFKIEGYFYLGREVSSVVNEEPHWYQQLVTLQVGPEQLNLTIKNIK